MMSFEIVGYVWRGETYCAHCVGRGDPIFAGDEAADELRCSECGDVLSGEEKTLTERRAEEALEAKWAEEAEAQRSAEIERALIDLEDSVAETENDVEALKQELERKRAVASVKRAELLKRLEEGT